MIVGSVLFRLPSVIDFVAPLFIALSIISASSMMTGRVRPTVVPWLRLVAIVLCIPISLSQIVFPTIWVEVMAQGTAFGIFFVAFVAPIVRHRAIQRGAQPPADGEVQ
jgi:hypothetical protein